MRREVLVLIMAAMLAGCGLKGPLYMPDAKPASKKATKPATAPPPTNQDRNP